MSATRRSTKAPRPAQGKGSLRVGRLTKPHGLKGGIKLELYTDNPELRFVPGAVFSLQVPEDSPWTGRTVEIRELRWFNGAPVVFFEEVPDRTAAESIVRAILWIDEDAVRAGQEDNAWYDHQLVGLEVRRGSAAGDASEESDAAATVSLGTVSEVQHLPAQDLLVVETPAGTVLVPFVEAIVPSVDVARGFVVVTPPDGLFEQEGAEARAESGSDGPDQTGAPA